MTVARLTVPALLLLAAPAARAQVVHPAPPAARLDTVAVIESQVLDSSAFRRPVSPMGAFWRSFLIPGWGQAKLNRKLTGGLFIAFEGLALGMVVKTTHQVSYLERTDIPAVDSKKQQQEDWIALLVFNHLMSGLEAFVSAHLWDFPDDLRLEGVPGTYGAQLTIPVRLP